jgi:hypothetical protein
MVRAFALAIAFLTVACTSGDSGSNGDDTGDDDSPDGGFTDPGPDGNPANCGTDIVEAPTTAACAAATQTCVDACDTDECYDACLAADPDPDGCGTCLDDGYDACVNAAGCQAAWDTSNCCYEGCADPESDACATTCATQDAAWDTCIEQYDEQCTQSVATTCYRAT